MEIMLGIIIFILGLCFGSFVNMLVYRTAVQYGQISDFRFQISDRKRSFCDYCGKQLNWYENIPVFSWIVLKGKTRCCGKKLPLSYPIVEITTGLLFLTRFQISDIRSQVLMLIIGLIIIVLLVFSAVFDWKYMILPDFSTIVLIGCAIGLIFGEMWGRHGGLPLQQILSALIGAGFLLVLNLVTKGRGMGMGDVKFAIFMGLFLGYPKIIVAFYVAFIVGAIYGLILMILKKANKKSQVPFGPFLIFGTMVAWWFGEKIVELIRL